MLPLDMLNEPVWQRLTWTLLHFLWQGLAVATVVATLFRAWRVGRAHNRYLIYLSALIAMAACPLVTYSVIAPPASATVASRETEGKVEVPSPLMPHPDREPGPNVGVESATADSSILILSAETVVRESQPPRVDSEAVPIGPAGIEVAEHANPPVSPAGKTKPWRSIQAAQPYALAVWLAGVLLLAMRLSLSWFRVRRLARSRRVISVDLASKATTLGKRLGLRIPPPVCASEMIREAIVVGLWRPLILLPASWLMEMTPDVLEAVIAHELAHVRRLDLWVNLLQRLMEMLLFYHPAVWWLSRRLSVEREMCADELAVGVTSKRLEYVTALEQLGRMRLGHTAPQFGASIGGTRMVLLNRVGNILGASASNNRARWWPVGLLALAVPTGFCLASMGIVPSMASESPAEEVAVETAAEASSAVSVTGRLIGIDGKPAAAGYRITALPRAWSAMHGMMPTTVTDKEGAFSFSNLPDGPCDVAATSNGLTNQPNVRIEGVVLKQGKPVHVELSLAQKYAFAGRVTNAAGQPQTDRNVLAIWKDPSGKNTYSSNTKTDFFGRFHFSSAFEVAQRILVNDGGRTVPAEHQEVRHGREDVNFRFAARNEPDPDPDNPLGLDDDTLIKFFRAGSKLLSVAFDCESFHGDNDRLPRDVPDLASRYQEQSRDSIGNDPFAPGEKLRLILDKEDPRTVQVWSVGPDGDWDGGQVIDSTQKPLDGDLGVEIRVGNTDWHWLADLGMQRHLEGERLAHYLAAKGPKLPKPPLKDDGLKWGPVVDGLQLAVELTPKKDAYYLGEAIAMRFHFRNAADYAIQVGLISNRQDMSIMAKDEKGNLLEHRSVWHSGSVGTRQQTLNPGETASYGSSGLAFVAPGKEYGTIVAGHWLFATPGVYTVRIAQRFPAGYPSNPREWRGELETGLVTIRIAEQPMFAIHRIKGYRRPGDRPGMMRRIFFHESGNPELFDPTQPDRYPLEDLVADGVPLLTEADVLAYNWEDHSVKLKPGVGERLYKAVKLGDMYVPFVVQSGGNPLYLGAFRPPSAPNLADLPYITLMAWDPSLPEDELPSRDTLAIENRQAPLEGSGLLDDPRPDERLKEALQKAGILLDGQSAEPH